MKMTISLLQAYDWYRECPPDWKDRAYQSMLDMLNCKPFDNAAVKRGQAYEDKINELILLGDPIPVELEPLRGMNQQTWINPLTIKGYTFRGKMDYDSAESIDDLKTTTKYNKMNFLKKRQHKVYCLAQGITKFNYRVGIFPDESGLEPTSIEVIPITVNLEQAHKELLSALTTFEAFMKEKGLYDTYFKVFNGGRP